MRLPEELIGRSPSRAETPSPSRPAAATEAAGPEAARRSLPRLPDERTESSAGLRLLRVAAITDEFTFSSFAPECQLLQLSVSDWQQELEVFRPEMLFVESAWRGKDDQWENKVCRPSDELVGVISWCRAHGVPTVFWNKEDPVHFDGFLGTAKQFDWIFTTDVDCIPRYREAVGHRRVNLLPFACQPATTHPIETYSRKDAFCFAGSFYVRFPERTRDLEQIVTALSAYKPVEIYDRKFGDKNPAYHFPDVYSPFIVGHLPFAEIDRAYKGYRYGINLNSVKQSQSMCARRVFELLASNTVTVSNFSRAVRLLFGDLVITSDNGGEIVRRVARVDGDDASWRKFRLAGLRKVMHSHTYQDRLATIVATVNGSKPLDLLPPIVVAGHAANRHEWDAVLAGFSRQQYPRRRLVMVVAEGFVPEPLPDGAEGVEIEVVSAERANGLPCREWVRDGERIAGMVPADFYGPNYLLDLALATRYSPAAAIGKAAHYEWSAEAGCQLVRPGAQYSVADRLSARSSLLRAELVGGTPLDDWVAGLPQRQIEGESLLSIDEFNYCRNGAGPSCEELIAEAVNDLSGLYEGLSAAQFRAHAQRVTGEPEAVRTTPVRSGAELAAFFMPQEENGFSIRVVDSAWEITSTLPEDQTLHLRATTDIPPADLEFLERAQFHLNASPGLFLGLVISFLDVDKQILESVFQQANRDGDFAIPSGTAWIRLLLRLRGSGVSLIQGVRLGPPALSPMRMLCGDQPLVVARHYPSYDDLYKFGFVHTRVAGYARRGLRLEVFRVRNNAVASFDEYRNVDVTTGSSAVLLRLLEDTPRRSVLVHFLDERLWSILRHHVHTAKIYVWIHGSEIQPWYRRDFNNETEQQRQAAQQASTARIAFWRGLLAAMPANLNLIFVSNTFAEEVMEDIGLRIPPEKYRVIHNPIDTALFAYHPKPAEQRKKILSIASYASQTYANDLTVKAILELANRPWFGELEFRLIGDGRLFDEVLAPLRSFPNVIIERRFLSPDELCAMHREYGIFLRPSRCDSQGVSRDEAMASGLVPITNAVGAIPEFVDSDCGFLAPPEDSAGLAAGIEEIYFDEARFAALSFNASRRVRGQSDIDDIVVTEMSMFGTDHPATTGGGRSRGFSLPTEHHSRHDFPETTEKPREVPRTRSLKTLLEAPTAMGGEPERVMGFSEAPVAVNAQSLGRENLQLGKMVSEQAPVSASVGYSLAGRLSRQVSRFLSPLRKEIDKRHSRRVVASSPLFDAQWYGLSYPDVTAAGIDPVAHYLERGAVELRNPSSHFDTAAYLNRYPDVRELGFNPLYHYLLYGKREGREIGPLTVRPNVVDPAAVVASSPLFDAEWYCLSYPDVKAAGIDPVAHYLERGAVELRNPSSHFDTAVYLDRYPDVRESGLNPLYHYLSHGKRENREISPLIMRPHFFDLATSAQWVAKLRSDRAHAEIGSRQPLVSIILPTKDRAAVLPDAIRSVLEQTWHTWELLIVDDGSVDGSVEIVRRDFPDPRIKLLHSAGQGVCDARNTALSHAQGEFFAYLDSDNTWTPEYLELMLAELSRSRADSAYAVLKVINTRNPAGPPRINYRQVPFEGELLRVSNFIDLNVFMHRRELYAELGGFDTALMRMVDWDLILRYTARHPISFARFIGCTYADNACPTRITNRERLSYINVVRSKHLIDWERVKEGLARRDQKLVSVIICNYGKANLTRSCIESLYRHESGEAFEVILVENGSNPQTVQEIQDLVAAYPEIRLVRNPENYGFALGNNIGFAESRGSRVVFLNNDTQVTPEWLRSLVRPLEDASIKGTQPKLLFPDGSIQCVGVVFSQHSPLGYPIYARQPENFPPSQQSRNYSAITAACMAMRAEDFAHASGFDPLYLNGQEDVDLCLRVGGGRSVFRCVADSIVIHHEGQTAGRNQHMHANRGLFYDRWKGSVRADVTEYYAQDGVMVGGYRADNAEWAEEGYAVWKPSELTTQAAQSPPVPSRLREPASAIKVPCPPVCGVTFFPDYRQTNPYQTLLYQKISGFCMEPGTIAEARQRLVSSAGCDRVFHLHWTAPILGNAADRADAAVRMEVFLKELSAFLADGGRLVWTIHNILPHDCQHSDLEAELCRRLSELADFIHVHGQQVPDLAAPHYAIPQRKLVVGRHGSYLGVYPQGVACADARRQLGLTDDMTVLLFIGQIRTYKGLDHLVAAYRALKSRNSSLRLLIAGQPVRMPPAALEALAQVDPGIRIEARRIADEELQLFFAASDVTVLPYSSVLTSGTAYLSLSFGTPVIAPRAGLLSEVIEDGVNGFLYPVADQFHLELALHRYLDLPLAERAILRRGAAETAAKLDWKEAGAAVTKAFSVASGITVLGRRSSE